MRSRHVIQAVALLKSPGSSSDTLPTIPISPSDKPPISNVISPFDMYPTDQPLWYAPYQYRSALMICSATDIDQPLCYASCPFRSALMICSLPLIPISPCSMPPADSYQPLWYARQSTDSDQPLLDFPLFISISPYDVPPTDSDQLSWYAPQPVPISPSVVPPFQCDQPPCYVPYRHRSAPLWYIPYRCRSAPLWYTPTDADQI